MRLMKNELLASRPRQLLLKKEQEGAKKLPGNSIPVQQRTSSKLIQQT